ncbi:MAG: ABC transporter permease [Mycoplasmatales bacterium]
MQGKHTKQIYLFMIPAIIFTVIFSYIPMVGIVMAFENYNIFAGNNAIQSMFTSEWVGLENFRYIFSDPEILNVIKNTIEISFLKIIFLFPLPIIVAIMLNEVINTKMKKGIQTIIYLPHFLSWVIVGGIWLSILGGAGLINDFLMDVGLITTPIPFLIDNFLFRIVILITDAWKEIGWSAIIYLAAITAIDYQLYEAIKIDGGKKFQEIWYVTIPGILSTIVMLFILRIASIMDAGFDQIFNMYSPYVYEKNDILSTFVYRFGIGGGEYSIATAVGLFNSVIAFILVVSANKISKKLTNKSIW